MADLDLTDAEYQAVRTALKERTGIELADSKRALVLSRLTRRLSDLGISSFSAYLEKVEAEPEEASRFVSALTTNVTEFFRERHHFEVLAQVAPELARGKDLLVWSAACSTGEEPWSIALTLAELQPPLRWRVLATDIDEQVVAAAREAVYPMERVASVPRPLLEKHFWRDREGKQVKVKEFLQAGVSLGQLNLLEEWPMRGPFDVIFCRNVLIYFDTPTRDAVVRRMANLLRPGGYLMLGHSESLLGANPLLAPRGKTIFQRVTRGGAS